VNLASLGKSKQLQVGLFAYDGRGLSGRAFDVEQWPMLLVTAPLHAGLAGNHKHDYKIPDYMTQAPLRAIAFHPDGVDSVVGVLDSTTEIPMVEIANHVWQGYFDATKLDLYPHEIVVTASHGDEKDSQVIEFYTTHVEPPVESGPEGDCVSDCSTDIDADPEADAGAEVGEGTAETGFAESQPDAAGTDWGHDGASDWGTAWDSGAAGENYLADEEEASPAQPGVMGHIPGKRSGGCSAAGAAPAVPWILALVVLVAWLLRTWGCPHRPGAAPTGLPQANMLPPLQGG